MGPGVAVREDQTLPVVDWPWVRSAAWVLAGFLLLVASSRVALPKSVPFGVLLFGVVIGSINALIAIGLILIYRSNRIINFAHAEVGVFGGLLFENLVRADHWPWFLALLAGVFAAAALGGVLELLVLRRFATAPRLIVTVATIGIGQVVVVLTSFTTRAFGTFPASAHFVTPLSHYRLTVSQVVFSGDALLLLAVVPVVVVALEVLLRRTAFGVAMRASAESRDRAALLGVPVKTVATATWIIASGLAALAATLHGPVVGLLSGSSLQGPELLLRGLTAAVLARMENLRVAVVAALFLGVVEQSLYFAYGGSAVTDAVFVVIMIVALVVQRRPTDRAEAATSWVTADEIRPVPARLRRLPEVRLLAVGGLAAVGMALWALVATASSQKANLYSVVAIYCIVAVSLVVLTGWAGQIGLGQFGVAAVGAGVVARLSADAHWDFVVALVVGALAGAVIALVLGLAALRLTGFFFAVTSLGFAVAVSTYFLNPRFFRLLVPTNRPERPVLFGRFNLENERSFFVFTLAVLVVVIFSVARLRRSRTGRAIVAMRDNDRAAASYGMSPTRLKLLAFGLSGGIAGLAGGLLGVHQHAVTASVYAPNESLRVFSMVVIGGPTSLTGAVLGAIYVRGASYFLSVDGALLASGAGLLAVLFILPGGLARAVFRIRDAGLRRVARGRGVDVPSLQRECGVEEVAVT